MAPHHPRPTVPHPAAWFAGDIYLTPMYADLRRHRTAAQERETKVSTGSQLKR